MPPRSFYGRGAADASPAVEGQQRGQHPIRAVPSIADSACFSERDTGLEPVTPSLGSSCSTN
jgi:hypothetical protein